MLNSEIMSNDSSDGDVSLSSGNVENVEPNETNADCRPCDPLKVLKFVECLSATTNSIEMQILVNKYLQELTSSPYVFLIPLLPTSEEGLIQVIGDRKLDKEIRFSIPLEETKESTSEVGFNVILKEASPDLAEIIEMVVGKENSTLIFEIQNTKITSPSNTVQQNSLYVCIAGDGEKQSTFSYYLNETFRYISGHLLTSFDLFEKKLVRTQCQNLLQVARRLLSKIAKRARMLIWELFEILLSEFSFHCAAAGIFCVSCPPPLKPRDFVLMRSWLDTGPQGEQMLLSRSVPHKDYPPRKGFIRAMSYITGFVIRPQGNGGCFLGYVAHCDPQGKLPPWLVNKVTHTVGPRMVKDLRKASEGYVLWKTNQPHNRKPWRYPEEITCPRIFFDDCIQQIQENDNSDVSENIAASSKQKKGKVPRDSRKLRSQK